MLMVQMSVAVPQGFGEFGIGNYEQEQISEYREIDEEQFGRTREFEEQQDRFFTEKQYGGLIY